MIESLPRDEVTIERNGCKRKVRTTHVLFLDVLGADGRPTGQRGQYLGIGVTDERGFEFYIQREDIVT